MFESIKAKIIFPRLMKRPDINKAYAMVGPEDSWYDTITKVHDSLAEIKKLPHEILEIKSHDGYALKGIYYPCENARATMIYIHGYTSHAEREGAFPGLFYRSLGCNVLIPYQRAHGLSQGKQITLGALECFDMIAWAKKISEISPDQSIIIHGLSMGGGISLLLSDKEMPNVKCLISDAPTESVESFFINVSRDVCKRNHEKVYRHGLEQFKRQTGVDALDFNCIETTKNSRYPILLSAGSLENLEDRLKQVKENNPCDTEIVILEGCNHGNGMYKQTKIYQDAIKNFVEKYI